jgi:hypothetical protein
MIRWLYNKWQDFLFYLDVQLYKSVNGSESIVEDKQGKNVYVKSGPSTRNNQITGPIGYSNTDDADSNA